MAHGIPHNRVRNQAIHVPDGANKSSEKQGSPLHLEGHRVTYNPYKRLTYIVGIIGFLGIAGLTGAEWILDRISYAVEQNTQSLREEEGKIEAAAIRYRAESDGKASK